MSTYACDEHGEVDFEPPVYDPSRPMGIRRLWEKYRELRPVIVDGLLRRGEVCNIIASPKIGKSFLAGGLAWSVATGQPWLGFDTVFGNVLILDNELHPETLSNRLWRIAQEMEIDTTDDIDTIDVMSLRGQSAPIHSLEQHFGNDYDRYSLIVLDALYRTLPEGTNENDNAAMMAVYNWLDRHAARMNAAFVVVHHSSKGDQSDKSITDVGSGAGSISRAADTHLIIRPHEQPGFAVLEAVTRSFKSPDPLTIQWCYPIWQASTLEPEIKRKKPPRAETKEIDDAKSKDEILKVLGTSDKPMLQQRVIEAVSFGAPKAMAILNQMANFDKTVKRIRRKQKGGKKFNVFWQVLTEVLTTKTP
ncbi:MAG: AAA family ATPase [Pirellulaceae bacterium]|nr:AAA family ATPase [Pirellulaceae bacterium]